MKSKLEILADQQHEIWSHWMKYLFSVSSINDSGECIIPANLTKRWHEQADKPYSHLSEKEKESDREQAIKILKCLGEEV